MARQGARGARRAAFAPGWFQRLDNRDRPWACEDLPLHVTLAGDQENYLTSFVKGRSTRLPVRADSRAASRISVTTMFTGREESPEGWRRKRQWHSLGAEKAVEGGAVCLQVGKGVMVEPEHQEGKRCRARAEHLARIDPPRWRGRRWSQAAAPFRKSLVCGAEFGSMGASSRNSQII